MPLWNVVLVDLVVRIPVPVGCFRQSITVWLTLTTECQPSLPHVERKTVMESNISCALWCAINLAVSQPMPGQSAVQSRLFLVRQGSYANGKARDAVLGIFDEP